MKRKTRLLVDDAELFLVMEKSFLSRKELDLHSATSGIEALEIAHTAKPDLILLDLHMPGMDGDEVCTKLKADPDTEHIPVIIVTSERNPETLKRCINAGCDRIIYKPFTRQSLIGAVQEVLVLIQRRYPRTEVSLGCTVGVGSLKLETTMHVLSKGGAFIEMGIPPDSGSEIEVSFALPESNYTISTSAMVRWAASVRRGGPLGMGVEFLTIEEAERELIQAYIDEEMKKQRRKAAGIAEE